MWFPELKNMILGAVECLEVTLGNIFHGISHKDRFTMSTVYKSGLRPPILSKKLHVFAYVNSLCFANSYAGEGFFMLSTFFFS